MNWISNLDKKFVIPILLGISVTTISCVSVAVLLYSMFGKDDEIKDDNNKRYQRITSRSATVQYKVPKQYVSAIIGRCGSVIRNIQKKTNTHISINKRDKKSPYVICNINGDEMAGIRLAESMIKDVLDSQPKIETYEKFVPIEGSLNFKNLYRTKHNAREIEKECEAQFIIDNNIHKSEDGKAQRKLIIRGTAEQIVRAITHIDDRLIQDEEYREAEGSKTCRFLDTSEEDELNELEDELEDERETDDEELESIARLHYKILETSIKDIVLKNYLEKSGKTIEEMKEHFKNRHVEIIIQKDPVSQETNGAILKGHLVSITKALQQIGDIVRENRSMENETQIPSNDDLTATNKNGRITSIELPSNDGINTVNISNNTSETSETFVSQSEDVIGVFVSAVKTPEKFWIHVIGPGITALDKLVSEMTEYYNKAENRELHLVKTVKPNQIVAAKFHYDNKWYRGKVLSIEDSQCKVFYVDYGDVETISINDVLELRTDMLCLRWQAVQCSLANTKPRENEWTPEACDKFNDLTHVAQWKPLIAKIKGYKYPIPDLSDRSYSPCIELYEKNGDEDIDIRETLIRLELAKFEEEVSFISANLLQEKYDIQSVSSSLMTQNGSNKPIPSIYINN